MFASVENAIAVSFAALGLGVAIAVTLGPIDAAPVSPTSLSQPVSHRSYDAALGADAMVGSTYGYASRVQYPPVFDPAPLPPAFPRTMLAAIP
jgi:hypothetical protein